MHTLTINNIQNIFLLFSLLIISAKGFNTNKYIGTETNNSIKIAVSIEDELEEDLAKTNVGTNNNISNNKLLNFFIKTTTLSILLY